MSTRVVETDRGEPDRGKGEVMRSLVRCCCKSNRDNLDLLPRLPKGAPLSQKLYASSSTRIKGSRGQAPDLNTLFLVKQAKTRLQE